MFLTTNFNVNIRSPSIIAPDERSIEDPFNFITYFMYAHGLDLLVNIDMFQCAILGTFILNILLDVQIKIRLSLHVHRALDKYNN